MHELPQQPSGRETAITSVLLVCASLLIIGSMYVLAAFFAIRSGFFDLTAELTEAQIKAGWGFLAAAITAAVATVGHLLAHVHRQRTLALQAESLYAQKQVDDAADNRFRLDTVISGLSLLSDDSGTYAPRAKLAGALASLVHLDHPLIALRSLAPAWAEGAIENDTAVWLISEVFDAAPNESKREAAGLLYSNARKLTNFDQDTETTMFAWPPIIYQKWPQHLPTEVRGTNLFTLLAVLMSQPRELWKPNYHWVLATLVKALDDEDESIKGSASRILNVLVKAEANELSDIFSGDQWLSLEGIQKRIASLSDLPCLDTVPNLVQRLQKWCEHETAALGPNQEGVETPIPPYPAGSATTRFPEGAMPTLKFRDDPSVPFPGRLSNRGIVARREQTGHLAEPSPVVSKGLSAESPFILATPHQSTNIDAGEEVLARLEFIEQNMAEFSELYRAAMDDILELRSIFQRNKNSESEPT